MVFAAAESSSSGGSDRADEGGYYGVLQASSGRKEGIRAGTGRIARLWTSFCDVGGAKIGLGGHVLRHNSPSPFEGDEILADSTSHFQVNLTSEIIFSFNLLYCYVRINFEHIICCVVASETRSHATQRSSRE